MSNITAYRVRNWAAHYENNRTRDMVDMRWVPVSNDHANDGYQAIMLSTKGNFGIYGAWIAIVQVASKCRPRGTLVRKDGHPHDAKSIAKITHGSCSQIQAALDMLSHPNIGWLEHCEIPAVIPHPACGKVTVQMTPNPQADCEKVWFPSARRNGNGNGKEITTAQTAAPESVPEIPKATKAPEDRTLAIPANLNTPGFKDAWLAWLEYRRQSKRKSYTPIGAQQQVNKLAEYGEKRAIDAILFSIRQGYQGIFEEAAKGGGFAQATKEKTKMAVFVPQTPTHPLDRAVMARKRLVDRARDRLSPSVFRSCSHEQEICGRMAELLPDMGEVIEWLAAEKELTVAGGVK